MYVRAFPDKGTRWLISNGGGSMPVWSKNGQELFYRNEDRQIMAVNRSTALLSAIVLIAAWPAAQTEAPDSLNIYIVDVEGGNATLFVSPSRESLLIDSGNLGPGAVRDADRIMAAVRDSRLSQIDNLITTHWHGDHFGGMAELAARVPIRHFIDHGPNVQPAQSADEFLRSTYPQLHATAKHTVAKPG